VTDHVTRVSAAPDTDATNCCDPAVWSEPAAGMIDTETTG
jgi:hypothetical protein